MSPPFRRQNLKQHFRVANIGLRFLRVDSRVSVQKYANEIESANPKHYTHQISIHEPKEQTFMQVYSKMREWKFGTCKNVGTRIDN